MNWFDPPSYIHKTHTLTNKESSLHATHSGVQVSSPPLSTSATLRPLLSWHYTAGGGALWKEKDCLHFPDCLTQINFFEIFRKRLEIENLATFLLEPLETGPNQCQVGDVALDPPKNVYQTPSMNLLTPA